MKIKFLTVLSLALFMISAGCRSNTNTNTTTNTATTNTANTTVVATATPIAQTNESAAMDPAMKSKIEAALKAKGFNDLTVDTSTTPATLRGSYPKDKIAEVMQTAMQANGGKPVQNQATGK